MNLETSASGSAVSITVSGNPIEDLKRTVDKLNIIIEDMMDQTDTEKCCSSCSC